MIAVRQTSKLAPHIVILVVAVICFGLQTVLSQAQFMEVSIRLQTVAMAILGISCTVIFRTLQAQNGTSVLAHRVKQFFGLMSLVSFLFCTLYGMSLFRTENPSDLFIAVNNIVRVFTIAILCGMSVKGARVASSVLRDEDPKEERIAHGRLRR